MTLTQNLLYLLLLYAVLDTENKLTVTTGILIALGIMLLGICCNPQLDCDRNDRRRFRTGFAFANGL